MENLTTSEFDKYEVIPLTEGQFLEYIYHEALEENFFDTELYFDANWTVDLTGDKPEITFNEGVLTTFNQNKWVKGDNAFLTYQVPDRFVNEILLTMVSTGVKMTEKDLCHDQFEESRKDFFKMAKNVLSKYEGNPAEYNIIYSTMKMRNNILEYYDWEPVYEYDDDNEDKYGLATVSKWDEWTEYLDDDTDLDVALLLDDDCYRVTYTHPEFEQRMEICKSLVPMTKSARK